MTIREATEFDIPSIVELLKLSLGESLMPKSTAFWRWKHIENPFGKSPVLLACDGDNVVGVRAFMLWEWRHQNQIIRSARAVDTAIHPDYQGKGIFIKLTQALLNQCRDFKIEFIFNTPNEKSLPGYLKLGWQKIGRLSINSHVRVSLVSGRKAKPGLKNDFQLDRVLFRNSQTISTNESSQFLQWRYLKNPNIPYEYHQDDCGWYIYRTKKSGYMKEMRVVEFFDNQKKSGELIKRLKQDAQAHNVQIITWAGFKIPLRSVSLPVGPVITIKNMQSIQHIDLANWNPTLGDMEVF